MILGMVIFSWFRFEIIVLKFNMHVFTYMHYALHYR